MSLFLTTSSKNHRQALKARSFKKGVIDASWAPLRWKRRLYRRSAPHQKSPVRTHTSFPNFLKIPDLLHPFNLLHALQSFFFSFSLIFNHIWKPRWFSPKCWSRPSGSAGFQGALETKKFHLSNTHLLTCHTWGCEQGRECPAVPPSLKPGNPFVHKHPDTTSKQAIPR